jgi:hypothetical protein
MRGAGWHLNGGLMLNEAVAAADRLRPWLVRLLNKPARLG